jgi:hypothetical protein
MNRRELLLAAVSTMAGVMVGSPTLRVIAGEVPTASASRVVLQGHQPEMVRVLAEMIIPATDTPGAIEAGVPRFIEMMVADWYTDTERGIFLDGLAALDASCRNAYGQDFLGCSVEQRVAALSEAEKNAAGYVSPLPPGFLAAMAKLIDERTPFFAKLKELTVVGYFSSEVGATEFLEYNPMPMRYDGDFDFAKVGTHWSY